MAIIGLLQKACRQKIAGDVAHNLAMGPCIKNVTHDKFITRKFVMNTPRKLWGMGPSGPPGYGHAYLNESVLTKNSKLGQSKVGYTVYIRC